MNLFVEGIVFPDKSNETFGTRVEPGGNFTILNNLTRVNHVGDVSGGFYFFVFGFAGHAVDPRFGEIRSKGTTVTSIVFVLGVDHY